jgi:gp16 family phage-associated protein
MYDARFRAAAIYIPKYSAKMTPEQKIKQEIRDAGITVSQWASMNGFKPSLVYAVLSGQRKCYRGQSREIAIAFGLMPELSVFKGKMNKTDVK